MSVFFSAIVVVFNEDLNESVMLNGLELIRDGSFEIIVVDNSDTPRPANPRIAADRGYKYLCMHRNAGLSAAYNSAIDIASGKYVCTFDDDSEIDSHYFVEMRSYALSFPRCIIAPIVLSGEKIFSPIAVTGFRYKSIRSLDSLPKKVSAINSGLTVPIDIAKSIRYDEALFLDCVDHDFIRRAAKQNVPVVVAANIKLHQDYSRLTDDKDTSIKRMKMFMKDYRVFCSDSVAHRAFCELSIALAKIKYAIRFSDSHFITLGA